MEQSNALMERKQSGGMVEVASSRQAQEVQAAMVIAQRFPRDVNRAFTRIMEDCKRKSLAEKAIYSYPRGGQSVTGPSIRLAETVAKAYGNLDFGVVELEKKPGMGNIPGESTMMAYCWDLETNTRSTKVFTVAHKRDTKQGSKNLTDERDIYEIAANNGARRLRACILSVIPADIVEAAQEECRKTMKSGQGPLVDRVRSMILAFKDVGVTQEMIEKHIGHNFDAITEDELVDLRAVYTSIKDGVADRNEFFEMGASVETEKSEAPKSEQKTVKNFAPKNKAEAEKQAKELNDKADKAALEAAAAEKKDPATDRKATLVKTLLGFKDKMGMSNKQFTDDVLKITSKKTDELTIEEIEHLCMEYEHRLMVAEAREAKGVQNV